jgi:hypothetical protein
VKQIINDAHLFTTAIHEGSQELIVELMAAITLIYGSHFTIVGIKTGFAIKATQNVLKVLLVTVGHIPQDLVCQFGRLDEIIGDV